jgi:hypothetical protein
MNDRITPGRALFDAAIIVGSIPLAFAIDAGWDAYRERADEQAVLASLEDEFVANLALLQSVVRRHEAFAERAAELDAMTEDQVRAIPAELVDGCERAIGHRKDPDMMALIRAKLFFDRLYTGELRRLSDHGKKVLTAIRANRN